VKRRDWVGQAANEIGPPAKEKYQVWHRLAPEKSFPGGYKRVAVVEATDLFDATKQVRGYSEVGDVVVTPSAVAYRFEGNGEFGVMPFYRAYEKFPDLKALFAEEDRAFAAAVLGIDSPSAEQVECAIGRQQMLYLGQEEDRALWQAYEDTYEQEIEGREL
jgi:hypothetical protein